VVGHPLPGQGDAFLDPRLQLPDLHEARLERRELQVLLEVQIEKLGLAPFYLCELAGQVLDLGPELPLAPAQLHPVGLELLGK